MLTLDAAKHEYRKDGVRVYGVTEILKSLGLVFSYPPSPALLRGKRVHAITAAYDLDQLDFDEWRKLDAASGESLWPWVSGYLKFLDETKPAWKCIETIGYHPVLNYAGTLDRFGIVLGHPAIVDLKNTQSVAKETALQTAGYAPLVRADVRLDKIKRYALKLPGNGSYNLIEYSDPSDHSVWNACVSLFNWKLRN
jgi:hypothetical protein